MKELLTLIIVLFIIGILFDGWRRMRNARYGNIRMSPAMKKRVKSKPDMPDDTPKETPGFTSELPNGGARVVAHRDSDSLPPMSDRKSNRGEKQARNQGGIRPQRSPREPQQTSLNLGESVPMLMEEVDDQRIEPTISSAVAERDYLGTQATTGYTRDDRYLDEDYPEPEAQGNYQDDDSYEQDDDSYEGEDDRIEEKVYDRELAHGRDRGREVEDQDFEDEYRPDDYDEEVDTDEEHSADDLDDYDERDDQEEDGDEDAAPPAEPEEVLIINVMAHKGEMFNGSELLDCLLKCGMRYGDMDIFHRHSDAKGDGALLFSMANMVKPGTFDLDNMDSFETPGVSLFMTLPLKADSMQSFELMLDTARTLADTLDGELKDEQRSVMTRQTIEHCRQRILDFERRRLFRRPR